MKDDGELGIKTGVDPVNGSYIEIELINPIDEFTAMYTLSSNLYTPIPKSFIQKVGNGDYTPTVIDGFVLADRNADLRGNRPDGKDADP